MDLPILYKKDKAGKIRYREYKIEGDTYYVRAGLLKTRETHEWKPHKRAAQFDPSHGSHKTAEEVALQHAQSDWVVSKRDDNYTTNLDDLISDTITYPIPIAPVLAVKYKDLEKRHSNPNSKYKFPDRKFHFSLKMDGERLTTSYLTKDEHGLDIPPRIGLFSRSRNELPYLEHIRSTMMKIYNSFGSKNPDFYKWCFDGEILEPGKTRNKMRSSISRILEKHEDNEKLVYYVFDIVVTTSPLMPFSKRYEILQKIFSKVNSQHVKFLSTIGEAYLGSDDIKDFLAQALDMGCEGIVGRDPDMVYPPTNHRVNSMVKIKPEETAEAEIYDCYCGQDMHQDLIMFKCRWPDRPYIMFDVTPKFDHETRKKAYYSFKEDPSRFVGKLVTLLYKSINEYGCPEECRAICIRDSHDLDEIPVPKKYSYNK